MNLHKAISSERILNHGTTYKLGLVTNIEYRVSQLRYENFKPKSFLEAQLFSIGHNYCALRNQMKNMKDRLHAAALKILNFQDKALESVYGNHVAKRRKIDKDNTSENPEKLLGKLLQRGNRNTLSFAYGISGDIPALLLHQVHVIDEAGQLEFYTCDCLAWLFWYGCSILGIKPKSRPVFYLVGSVSQSFALRTIDLQEEGTSAKNVTKKVTNETSLLSHLLDNKIVYSHLEMNKKGRVTIIHTGKRSVLPALQNLRDSLWLGLKDVDLIAELDDYLVPESLIMDPACGGSKGHSSISSGMNKDSVIIDHSKVDLSNYIRIFSSQKKLQEYRNKAECLKHVDIPVISFVNYHDAQERYKAYVQKSILKNYFHDKKGNKMAICDNVEDFTSKLLAGKLKTGNLQFLGNASLASISMYRILPTEVFSEETSFYPPEKSHLFSRHHIRNPCTVDVLDEYKERKGSLPRKLNQRYMIYKGKIQVILDKFAHVHKGQFLLTGYHGSVEQLMNTFMGDVLLPLENRAPRYVLKMYQQIYTTLGIMKETSRAYYQCSEGDNDSCDDKNLNSDFDTDGDCDLELSRASAVLDVSAEGEGEVDFLTVEVDHMLTNDVAKLYLNQGRARIISLYNVLNVDGFGARQETTVFIKNPSRYIAGKEGIFFMQLNRDFVMTDYVKQAEVVLVKDKIPIPSFLLKGHQFDTTRRIYDAVFNQIRKKRAVVTESVDMQLYGLYIQRQSGQLGILLPSEYSFVEDIINDEGNRVFNNLMLSISCCAVSELGLTVPISQGMTIDNVAVLVEPSMCIDQISPFVALTRAKYNVVLSANPFKTCRYIPQHTILRSMLNQNTRHVI